MKKGERPPVDVMDDLAQCFKEEVKSFVESNLAYLLPPIITSARFQSSPSVDESSTKIISLVS